MACNVPRGPEQRVLAALRVASASKPQGENDDPIGVGSHHLFGGKGHGAFTWFGDEQGASTGGLNHLGRPVSGHKKWIGPFQNKHGGAGHVRHNVVDGTPPILAKLGNTLGAPIFLRPMDSPRIKGSSNTSSMRLASRLQVFRC